MDPKICSLLVGQTPRSLWLLVDPPWGPLLKMISHTGKIIKASSRVKYRAKLNVGSDMNIQNFLIGDWAHVSAEAFGWTVRNWVLGRWRIYALLSKDEQYTLSLERRHLLHTGQLLRGSLCQREVLMSRVVLLWNIRTAQLKRASEKWAWVRGMHCITAPGSENRLDSYGSVPADM